jgi:membrane protease YdiL (CAAX protease family)
MQPIPWTEIWSQFWPLAADTMLAPRLVTGGVAVFVVGAWLGRLVAHPLAAKLVAGGWMAVGTAGLVARLGLPLADTAIVPRIAPPAAGLAFGLGLLVIPLLIIPLLMAAVRLPEMRHFYPEIWPRLPARWQARHRVAAVAGGWLVYLLGYEALFRGLLLPGLVAAIGIWPGIAVATGLYVLAHLDRPSAETLASIPTGFVFALLTLATGSFLAALLLHWIIATTNELAAAARGPAAS